MNDGLRHPGQWTLRAKLVASMLALFTVIAVITSATSIWSLNASLTRQTDDQLRESLQHLPGGPDPGGDDNSTIPSQRRGPGNEGLIAEIASGLGYGRATDGNGTRVALTSAQLTALQNAQLGNEPRSIDLGDGLGEYRVAAASASGVTRIVGLPNGPRASTIRNALSTSILTTILGLLAVGAAGTWLIRRNLRPLDRVAATATAVAALPLDQGKVALAERVPAEFTDRRTEVGKVGHAVNDMLDHITEALTARHQSEQRVRQFVADASHELRTPLASIKGYAELSRRERDPVPETVTHALSRVESEADRMSSLVEDLLLLARLDAGRPLERQPVDLSQLVVNAVSDAHAASRRHAWELDLPEEPVEVVGDQGRLQQVVGNLLANARAHTPEGTVIRTTLRSEGDEAFVAVHDNGPGVPAALQPNVFQRFARGDSSRNRAAGSTGLGLSIVAAVAGAHGGRVSLASSPGDTTFTVAIPVAGPAHPSTRQSDDTGSPQFS